MRLRRLDLTRYGKFTDYSIDFGERVSDKPDLHIVYGLNEAGKSTSLSAYLDLLFGIEERTRYGFLHQGKAMEVGGCLEFGGEAHEFKRVKQRANSLLDAQGQPVNEAVLSVPLAGLTRDAYRMMFSLDDQTLEDGGNAILESRGDLGELLFSASAGLAGTSGVLEKTMEEALSIFRKRASSTTIAGLKRRMAEIKARRDEIDTQASAYASLKAELQRAEAAYEEVTREIGTARTRQEQIARMLRAHPLAGDYRRLEENLAAYADVPRPPAEWSHALPELIDAEARLQTRRAGLDQREARIRDEIDALTVDERLLELDHRIERLSEAAARYTTAEEDLPKRKSQLSEQKIRVDLILTALGKRDVDDAITLVIPAATIGMLRDLLAEKNGIDVALRAAEKEFENGEQVLEDAQAELKGLEAGGVLDAITVARLQASLLRIRQGDLAAELRLAERSLAEKVRAYEEAVGALQPWTGTGDEVKAIRLPDAARLEAWRSTADSLQKRRAAALDRKRELETRLAEDKARIEALRSAGSVIGDEEASALMAQRNDAWTKHLEALDRETAVHFEQRMHAVDEAADARLKASKELEELRALTAASAVTSAAIQRQDALLSEADEELAQLRAEIVAEAPAALPLPSEALIAVLLATFERWSRDHAKAVAAWDALQAAQRAADDARAAAEAEREALSGALENAGMEASGLALSELVQAAENLISAHTAAHTKRVTIEKQVADLTRNLASRQRELDQARATSEEWQRRWKSALDQTWFAGMDEAPGAVRELLDALTELPVALKEFAGTQHRIDAMEADRAEFVNAVSDICDALGEPFDQSRPVDAARALIRGRDEARQTKERREEKLAELAAVADEREVLGQQIALHEARRNEMTSFFDVESITELRQALELAGQRDRLVEERDRLARQIIAEAQEETLEAALSAIADVDLAELQREQAELAVRIENLDERAKTLFADRTRAQDRLDAIGGDDTVARIDAERRTILLEMEEQALRYLRLRSGSMIAEHAIRAYRDRHRSAMMNRASEAFRQMTRGEYTGLATRPEKDRETLIGLSARGGSKLAMDMSKGTRFQLYLALRLAGYEEFAAARPSVPFVADDIMETFDEPRSEEVLRLFGQMSQVGQVIYLTHHRHLCDLAAKVVPGVKIHEIATA